MIRKLVQIRNMITFVLFFESVGLFSLYLITNNKVLFNLAMYSIIKNAIMLVVLFYMNYLLDNNHFSVADALGQDAKHAFLFGGIGLIQYDENRNITWTSDLFKELNINIIGVKLLEWQPLLASLFEDEDIKLIDIKGKKFEAYNSLETKLIYLKDVTQLISLQQDYQDQQVCMAYITIEINVT